MAQRTVVQLIDDLDGNTSDDISRIEFSLDGVVYEIDLNDANATQLRENLARFVDAARRTGGRIKRGTAQSPSLRRAGGDGRSKDQTRAIRDWARTNGHQLADRGRIPASIVEAFEAAH
ncbi:MULTISPECIES: Lsr2 family protein [unclassified Crossiella]|uniref:histone-like nucleoid-structuring protein Lsr2 n=1 Tax=unclassified Crossiella TaxID=2620835 RepID=UPI001FFF635A|nr:MULTISPECIES: Lsr2 family protein [unclassified Crossiella]MCK2245214.1 Lsr2 family protein [Crossiella sp. S99.2]MCK2258864.1 Lsr2 family protein [Crossiella sp. S99.1]